jgi:hypothetical protein
MFFKARKLVDMNRFVGHFDDTEKSQVFVHLWNDWTL